MKKADLVQSWLDKARGPTGVVSTMNFNLKQLQDSLCHTMCADIRLIKRNGHVVIRTPFSFDDGDPYILYIEETAGGILKLSDKGHTLMHLSYENDIDKFRLGTRGRLFHQILIGSGIKEENGEFFIESKPNELGSDIFRFSQALTSITDLTFLNRARAESTFYEDLTEALNNILNVEKVKKDYIYSGIENAADYPIDYRIEGKTDPLFVFGIPNRDKARLTTIVLERLLRSDAQFDSILIFADQGSIPSPDLARLSNAGGEMVASLDAQDELRRKVTRRAA